MSAPATEPPDLEQILADYLAAQGNPPKPTAAKKSVKRQPVKHVAREWVVNHRGQLTVMGSSLMLGPAGDILAAADDGWKTALAVGVAGATAAGSWGWMPGVWKWKRVLPAMNDRIIALSAPVTGSTLLTTMAATGGPDWGHNPWWGFSLAWSLGYGTWFIRRRNRPATTDAAPNLTQEMLDWMTYAAVAEGPYPKSRLVSPIANPKGGWSAEIHVPRGKSFKIVALDDVLSSLGIDDPDLVALEKLSPRKGRITVFTENPLKKGTVFGPQHVLDPKTGLAPFGVYYDDAQANYRFFLPGSGAVHDFITGTSGSGKSRALDGLLGIERRSPLMCSIVIDPQAGLSLPDWPDGVAVFAPGNAFGIVVLRAAHALMKERGKRYNRLKWVDDKGRTRVGRAFFVPGDPDPLICVTLDEAHDLLNDPEFGEEAVKIVADLAKEARKVGIKFRLANQSPNASELGGETLIRDILQGGNNLVLRSGSSATGKRAAGNALGDIDPGAIPKEFNDGTSTGGLGYLAGPDNRAAMWRAPYVEDPFGLAHEGETTGIEQASIDALPIIRHILEEHALMLRLRNAGEDYTYDPARFTDGGQPVVLVKTAPAAPAASVAAPAGTAEKIAAYLRKTGRPTAPAVIAKALGLTGPQVRQCLKREKDKPGSPIVALDHGAYVHADHAADYQEAA